MTLLETTNFGYNPCMSEIYQDVKRKVNYIKFVKYDILASIASETNIKSY